MDWMYLLYFLLGLLVFFGAISFGKGIWNEEYTSLKQTKSLLGITAFGIALHHLAEKTCAPWNPKIYIVHGLDPFVSVGYLFVGVFLFCSGLGLYKSQKNKPDYLKGFLRRRILPVVIAFYLSEFLYTAVRLAMGEKMNLVTVLWYLSGLHMANTYSWYVIVIPFFYLAFWAAFRFCRREGAALFLVFLFTIGYTALCACIDRQNDWWIRGEWWYNSIILFPMGMIFAKHELKITQIAKKIYWLLLPLSLAMVFLLSQQSDWLIDHRWGYYGEYVGSLKILHRLLSAESQWLVCLAYTSSCFLLMMKIRFGNRILSWLGAVTLDFYLIHGLFVELFGYNFLGISGSLFYIKNAALYTAVVLACSVPGTLLFGLIRKKITGLIQKEKPERAETPSRPKTLQARVQERRERAEAYGKSHLQRILMPAIILLVFLGLYFFLDSSNGNKNIRIMNRLKFQAPEAFTLEHGDSYNAIWKCTETDKKAGYMILDTEIPDGNARSQDTLERILSECDWLTGRELYVNPQGIRMVRGFVDYSGQPERRYYIESPNGIMVLCMKEDERYYDTGDCEEAMLQMADSIRLAD